MILVPYVFLTTACVWKLEIKVLLYLPVSQPLTVTMVLVSIKNDSSSIGLCCVATLYYTPFCVNAWCNIIGKSLQLSQTDWNNARATKLNLNKSEISITKSEATCIFRFGSIGCNIELTDLNFLLALNSEVSLYISVILLRRCLVQTFKERCQSISRLTFKWLITVMLYSNNRSFNFHSLVKNVINSSEYVYAYQLLQRLIEFPINILIDANYSIILCNYHITTRRSVPS